MDKRSNSLRPLGLRHAAVALAMCLAGSAFPASAAIGPDSVLGNHGEVVRVRSGAYGELFPGDTQGGINPTHRVLALDFEHADGRERLLVPHTETWRPDRHPMLAYDSRSEAVMLFWVSGAADGTWSMELTSYRDGEWLESSNVKSRNSAVFIESLPKVAVTTDDFYFDLGEELDPVETRRTTFHVVWHEGTKVRYAPISFVDGAFVGWSEALSLTDLVFQAQQGEGDELPPGSLPASLEGSLSLAPALDPNAVSVTLTDAATGRLANLRVEETPMTLSHLAERVRDDILDQLESYSQDDLEVLADFIRSDIIFIGAKSRLHPTVGRFLADEIAGWILAHGDAYGEDLTSMGLDAWQETLDAGASIYAKTLGTAPVSADPSLDLSAVDMPEAHARALQELVRITLPASFEAPEVGQGDTFIYTSADQRSLLVGWKANEGDTIHYVENRGLGWTAPQALRLGAELDEATAHDLLRRKIR